MAAFLGQHSGITSDSAYETVVNVESAVPAGSTLVAYVAFLPATVNDVASVAASDSQGNTWTPQAFGILTGVTSGIAVLTCQVTTPLSTSDTITITPDQATSRCAASILGFDALLQVDATLTDDNGGDAESDVSIGPSDTAGGPVVLAGWCMVNSGRTVTPGTGFTGTDNVRTDNGSGDRAAFVEYRLDAQAGPQSAGMTLNSAGQQIGALVAMSVQESPGVELDLVSADSVAYDNNNGPAYTLPAVQDGDLAVAVFTCAQSLDLTVPAGWTEVGSVDNSTVVTAHLLTRTLTASDSGAQVTFAMSGYTRSALSLVVMRGVTGVAASAGAAALTTPAVTATDDAVAVSVWSFRGTTPPSSLLPPGGMNLADSAFGSGSGECATAVALNMTPATGTLGGKTWAQSGDGRVITWTVALTVDEYTPTPPGQEYPYAGLWDADTQTLTPLKTVQWDGSTATALSWAQWNQEVAYRTIFGACPAVGGASQSSAQTVPNKYGPKAAVRQFRSATFDTPSTFDNAMVHTSWKNTDLAGLAAGSYDTGIAASARAMNPGDVFDVYHEAENDGINWTQYVAAKQHIYQVVKTANPDVWVACTFTGWAFDPRAPYTPEELWADGMCDVIGVDLDGLPTGTSYTTYSAAVEKAQSFSAEKGVAWSAPEWSVRLGDWDPDHSIRAGYIASMGQTLIDSNCLYVCWFDYPTSGYPVTLTTDAEIGALSTLVSGNPNPSMPQG